MWDDAYAATLEPRWVGSSLSTPSSDDDCQEAKMSSCPLPSPRPRPEGGSCSPADSAPDLGRTPFRSRWAALQASACLLECGEGTKPCPPLASQPTGPRWAGGASGQPRQPSWQGSTSRPTLAHSQEQGQTAHSASSLSSRTLSRQLGAWTQEVWDQTLDVVRMGGTCS